MRAHYDLFSSIMMKTRRTPFSAFLRFSMALAHAFFALALGAHRLSGTFRRNRQYSMFADFMQFLRIFFNRPDHLKLVRRWYTVSIGKSGRGAEVDFVAVRDMQTEYYQVSASVLDENTLERELASLRQIGDNYPKYLLTLDDFAGDHGGIRQCNLIDWLLAG
jgi:hypothetical protein